MTVTQTKHIVEIQHMEKCNFKNHIRRIDKDRYLHLETGEINEYNFVENRGENENSLRQTFKRMRYLINNNFEGKGNELHVILTYRENMTDLKRLYIDFDKFRKRLKYAYRDSTAIDYISVVEPQGRGAWHCHVLMRFNDLDDVFVLNKRMRDLWGHGIVRVNALKDVDNIGAYLSAYLTDLVIDPDDKAFKNAEGEQLKDKFIRGVKIEGKDKMVIKGGRLHMYPPGMNIYRSSKGIKPPERVRMRYKNINKIVGSGEPHFRKTYKIEIPEFENKLTYIQYNLKRDK